MNMKMENQTNSHREPTCKCNVVKLTLRVVRDICERWEKRLTAPSSHLICLAPRNVRRTPSVTHSTITLSYQSEGKAGLLAKQKLSLNLQPKCTEIITAFVATNKDKVHFSFQFMDIITGSFATLFWSLAGLNNYIESEMIEVQPIGVTNHPRTFVFLTPSLVKSGNCPSTMGSSDYHLWAARQRLPLFAPTLHLLATNLINKTYGSSTYERASRLSELRKLQDLKCLRKIFTTNYWSLFNPSWNGTHYIRNWYTVFNNRHPSFHSILLFQGDG